MSEVSKKKVLNGLCMTWPIIVLCRGKGWGYSQGLEAVFVNDGGRSLIRTGQQEKEQMLTGFEIWLLLLWAGDARQRLHLPPVERLVLSPTGSTGFKMLHFKLEEIWLNTWLCLIESLFINPLVLLACLKGLCLNTFYCFWFLTTKILNWRVIREMRHHEADVCGEKCLDALELPWWGHMSDFLQRLHAILVLTSK